MQVADVAGEWYQCLSCSFRGVREPRGPATTDPSPEDSWMGHAIMENHLIGESFAS